ncbi:hypothetical protein CLOSYM_00666 [[Clostridium] symbiosum ATCC 14940]|uniref:Uncharacterized protein n=1 Tax=[Clostridium] symbiosum ATCC 14940 TaxID=411472 RepID=A0ABC9U2B9_CLOSY|nr:hypothetical protein CLOSYM_00666 [[Clostridium] symbiosum ATCC 14940]
MLNGQSKEILKYNKRLKIIKATCRYNKDYLKHLIMETSYQNNDGWYFFAQNME